MEPTAWIFSIQFLPTSLHPILTYFTDFVVLVNLGLDGPIKWCGAWKRCQIISQWSLQIYLHACFPVWQLCRRSGKVREFCLSGKWQPWFLHIVYIKLSLSVHVSVCLSVSLFLMHSHIFGRSRPNLACGIPTPQGRPWAWHWVSH